MAGIDDETWRVETAKRRRALLGSLTESALGRPLLLDRAQRPRRRAGGRGDRLRRPRSCPWWSMPCSIPAEAWLGSSVGQLISDGRDAGHALARLVHGDLAGLFDGPSTVRFDPDLPMISLDLSRISGSNQLIGLVMSCASAWMEAALADPEAGQRYVIYDEAWRLIAQPSLLARMQSQWKLSRALGIANLMVIHRLSDLDAVGDANSEARNLALGLLADCSTKIIYAQEAGEAKKTGGVLGLSSTEIEPTPGVGHGRGAVADRRALLHGAPYLHAGRTGAVRHQRSHVGWLGEQQSHSEQRRDTE